MRVMLAPSVLVTCSMAKGATKGLAGDDQLAIGFETQVDASVEAENSISGAGVVDFKSERECRTRSRAFERDVRRGYRDIARNSRCNTGC